MPIRSVRSSAPARSFAVLLLILIALAVSCTREDALLLNLKSSTSLEAERELLTLTFSLSQKEESIQVTVEASDRHSSWVVSASPAKGGLYTIGPLTMGQGVELPEGEYLLTLMLDDGQLIEEHFTVRRP